MFRRCAGRASRPTARVSRPGQLEKPAGVPLRAELSATLAEDAVQLKGLTFDFHTLRLRPVTKGTTIGGRRAAPCVDARRRALASISIGSTSSIRSWAAASVSF